MGGITIGDLVVTRKDAPSVSEAASAEQAAQHFLALDMSQRAGIVADLADEAKVQGALASLVVVGQGAASLLAKQLESSSYALGGAAYLACKAAPKEHRMTQAQYAEAVGVSQTTVSQSALVGELFVTDSIPTGPDGNPVPFRALFSAATRTGGSKALRAALSVESQPKRHRMVTKAITEAAKAERAERAARAKGKTTPSTDGAPSTDDRQAASEAVRSILSAEGKIVLTHWAVLPDSERAEILAWCEKVARAEGARLAPTTKRTRGK